MEIEWLILADFAQVVGNKLYLMGGGWDVLTVNSGFPRQQSFTIAVSVSVPWNETNKRHDLELDIQNDDGITLGKAQGQFEVGRPAGIRPGQNQRLQVALNSTLKLDAPGEYVIVARIGGQGDRRTTFNVKAGPMAQMKSPKKESEG